MKADVQAAAQRLAIFVGAPEAVGILGWGVDSKPRIRVFADEHWLRSNAALPKRYAGYQVEVQARGSVCSYEATERIGVMSRHICTRLHLDE
jgi:hypothetical protein